MKDLEVLNCECDCEKCQNMCHLPCIGSVEGTRELIEAGYGDRLCIRDHGDEIVLKPALKGEEGLHIINPAHIYTEKGCTFWKDGKCELHDTGLKPLLGKISYHEMTDEIKSHIRDRFKKEWTSEEAKELIKEYKERFQPEEVNQWSGIIVEP